MVLLNAEDRTVIKLLQQTKNYGAKRLWSAFPSKKWSLAAFSNVSGLSELQQNNKGLANSVYIEVLGKPVSTL